MRTLLAPSNSWLLVSLAILAIYVILPAVIYVRSSQDPYILFLAVISSFGLLAIIAGFHLPVVDVFLSRRRLRPSIDAKFVHIAIWTTFSIFLIVTLVTADSIPILSAMGSATADQLSQERADFLKLRGGWQAALPYASTILVGVLLPYSTTRLFAEQSRFRYLALVAFILYTLLSLEKILFILAMAPLAVFVTQYYKSNRRVIAALAALAALSAGILYLNTVLASGDDYFEQREEFAISGETGPGETGSGGQASTSYFNIHYKPANAVELIVWRSIAVPVITAADGLRVFDDRFEGRFLLGATSSLLAQITRQGRVNFDAAVFEDQFGSSATGRANAVFFVEAYVNFGWFGVAIFSFIVGQALRLFARSDDLAFQCMWPVFCWFIFSGGLIGTMLSNGFAIVFVAMLAIKISPRVLSEFMRGSVYPTPA